LARLREGEAILAAGARSAAVRPLREAYERASALGAEPLRLEIEKLAQRARLALESPEPGPEAHPLPAAAVELGITRRELEVLELVAKGMTNREIAKALFISTKTANVHVSSLLGKLGVPNRLLAADAAARHGLV
jgi:DNA-binding NarL/FixJ family response regulator